MIRSYRSVDAFGPSGFRLSQMLVIEVDIVRAETRRSNLARSMQLPARYQVSMRSGCVKTKSDISRAPTGPIMSIQSKKCRTKVLLSRLVMT